MKKAYLLIFLTLLPLIGFAQDLSVAERNAQQGFNDTIDRLAEDFVEAYVSIAEPGDYLYTTLGHAAYHMKCPAFGLDYYFTMEGENCPDAVLRFIAGDLKMGMMALPPDIYLSYYRNEDRGVREWKLNLSPERKQQLWAVLDSLTTSWNGLPYDYYHRCCAITIVNVMNELVGRENIHYAEPWPDKFQRTSREFICDEIKKTHPWTLFFMCFLAGDEVDKDIPNERKFIVPMDVIEAWQTATVDGQPLLQSSPVEILPPGNRQPAPWCTPLVVALLMLALALLSLCSLWIKPRWIKIFGLVIDYTIVGLVTIGGFFLTYLLFVSDLCCTDWNWLFLAFNPLPALLWYWRKYWAIPYAILMIAWIIGVACAPHIVAFAEHMVLIVALCIVLLKQSAISFFLTAKA